VALAVSDVVQIGRLPLPGLDPDQRYRVRPVTVGQQPRGLSRPNWWGGTPAARAPWAPSSHEDTWRAWPPGIGGVVLSGAALGSAGVTPPGLRPEQIVLLGAHAVS
jgi:alpha-galactosidase